MDSIQGGLTQELLKSLLEEILIGTKVQLRKHPNGFAPSCPSWKLWGPPEMFGFRRATPDTDPDQDLTWITDVSYEDGNLIWADYYLIEQEISLINPRSFEILREGIDDVIRWIKVPD